MERAAPGRRAAPVFVFASGFSALVYQVIWLRDLGLLFGNTAQASAVGLAVFFAGLAAGASCWGARSARPPRPLAAYGWLELGVLATAVAGFWLLDAYRLVYAPLLELAGPRTPLLLLAAKTVVAVAVLLPPAFFMGGTVPVLAQAVIRQRREIGRTGALLYGLNTIGAAAGAFAAGFLLPLALGLDGTYAVALAVTAALAAAALWLSSGARAMPPPPAAARPRAHVPHSLLALAAASGGLMLALEVVAIRLFAQVLQNSIYTFSTVLVVFLLALGGGAMAASRLARLRAGPALVLAALLTMAGLASATIPFTFDLVTSGFTYVGGSEGWYGYLTQVASTVALVLAIPCVVAGIVFPFLLRAAQQGRAGAGQVLGTLTAWNLAGAIAGSLLTGFVLLPTIGLRGVFTLIPAVYLAAALIVAVRARPASRLLRAAPVAGLVLLASILNPMRLPLVRVDEAAGERVLWVRESAYGVTAVIERDDDRRIRVNTHYSLGGSGAADYERHQALLPVTTHPHPRSVYFLGMGTGITAGAALQPPVGRVVVTELIPDVVEAARHHFRDSTNALFDDPRVTIVTADGRSHLAATRDRYDLVIADLFVPWETGAGSLYTREHFSTVRDRLTSGGVFVQWLPLYQLSRREFMIIARTMLEVFPQVVLWRGDFLADRPIVALAGSVSLAPLDPHVLATRAREIPGPGDEEDASSASWTLPYYAGNLSQARQLVPEGPLNTDRWPVLEYVAPVTHRQQRIGAAHWFSASELLAFFEDLQRAVPSDVDPYLMRLSPADREQVRAGLRRYAAAVEASARATADARRQADRNDTAAHR